MPSIELPDSAPRQQTHLLEASIDPEVFHVNLWNPPPLPPQAPAEQAKVQQKPAPPINVQLIAIIKEDGAFKAVLYDSDADKLLIVSDGDRLRDNVVTEITQHIVVLSNGQSKRRLALREERS